MAVARVGGMAAGTAVAVMVVVVTEVGVMAAASTSPRECYSCSCRRGTECKSPRRFACYVYHLDTSAWSCHRTGSPLGTWRRVDSCLLGRPCRTTTREGNTRPCRMVRQRSARRRHAGTSCQLDIFCTLSAVRGADTLPLDTGSVYLRRHWGSESHVGRRCTPPGWCLPPPDCTCLRGKAVPLRSVVGRSDPLGTGMRIVHRAGIAQGCCHCPHTPPHSFVARLQAIRRILQSNSPPGQPALHRCLGTGWGVRSASRALRMSVGARSARACQAGRVARTGHGQNPMAGPWFGSRTHREDRRRR